MKTAAISMVSLLCLASCVGEPSSTEDGPPPAAPIAIEPTPVPPANAPPASAPAAVPGGLFQIVDDMEAGVDNFASPLGLASWSTRGSGLPGALLGNAGVVDLSQPRAGSRKARSIHSATSDFVDHRLDLHGYQFPTGRPYPDLSAYLGIAFWARGGVGSKTVRIAVEDQNVTSVSYQDAVTSGKPWFERSVTLSGEWQRHILLFSDFEQPNGKGGTLDTKAIWSIHFLAGGPNQELLIDDLALLCNGVCPAPPLRGDFSTTAVGLDEKSLTWLRDASQGPDLGCAEIASLTMTSPAQVRVGERLFLRVRIPVLPQPAVPLWGWFVRRLPEGKATTFAGLDQGWTTVAIPFSEPGEYEITTHSHYPGTATCAGRVRTVVTSSAP